MPGVWEIDSDDSIHLVQNEETGTKGLLAPEQGQFPDGMHTHFGWVYHTTAVSEDGRIIVGYAENAKGFTWGRFSIPAGTTVGVYWKVQNASHGKHVRVSSPFIIGTLQTSSKPRSFHPHWAMPFPSFLTQLKIFFLDRLAVLFDHGNSRSFR